MLKKIKMPVNKKNEKIKTNKKINWKKRIITKYNAWKAARKPGKHEKKKICENCEKKQLNCSLGTKQKKTGKNPARSF